MGFPASPERKGRVADRQALEVIGMQATARRRAVCRTDEAHIQRVRPVVGARDSNRRVRPDQDRGGMLLG